MKITEEELQKWLDSGSVKFDWMHMTTDTAKKISDKDLLGMISGLPVNIRGFGLIAELCKRFNNSNE